jgi:hypothetical protein
MDDGRRGVVGVDQYRQLGGGVTGPVAAQPVSSLPAAFSASISFRDASSPDEGSNGYGSDLLIYRSSSI